VTRKCFVASLVLLLVSPLSRAQDVLPGGSIIGVEFYGRPWNFVNDNEQFVLLRGSLIEWHTNKGDPPTDWDLCIHIQPSSGFEKYAHNTFGTVNPEDDGNPRGSIELEVKSLGNALGKNVDRFESFFGSLFRTKTDVEAYGPWVQDWGHPLLELDPKTELHPLTYLRQIRGDGTSLFVARDASERFDWSALRFANELFSNQVFHYVPGPQHFAFPLHNARYTYEVRRSTSSQLVPACLITEQSMMDISTNRRSSYWSGMVGFPYSPEYRIDLEFGEPSNVDRVQNGGGLRDLGQGHYHPFFLGKVTTTYDRSTLNTTATLSSKTCSQAGLNPAQYPPQAKVLVFAIDPTLARGSWGYSMWRLSKGSPESGTLDFETLEQYGPSANTGHFLRYYAPNLGFADRSWFLVTKASTEDHAHVVPKAGQGPGTVSYLYAETTFEIPISQLRLDLACSGTYTVEGATIAGSKWGWICASCDTVLDANVDLIPGATLVPSSFEWTVRRIRRSDGSDNPGFDPGTELTPANSPWSWQGIELTVDQADPYRLSFSIPQGKTEVAVTARAETDIGEHLSASRIVPVFGGCSPFGTADFAEAIARAEMVYAMLVEDGLIVPPRIPIEPEEIAKLVGALGKKGGGVPWPKSQRIAVLSEPERILPKLSGESRKALESFYRMAGGIQLTKAERNLVERLAAFGSKLEWSSQPPKGAFDALRKSLENLQTRQVIPAY
jgi:hypothetical protein